MLILGPIHHNGDLEKIPCYVTALATAAADTQVDMVDTAVGRHAVGQLWQLRLMGQK